ncbi:hypothetical protein SAMN05444724_0522 [Salinivibrio sp. ES.052]|nr:hypothetical protein SAMN05444724_0522 [Salinivibrio sp. ES.052]
MRLEDLNIEKVRVMLEDVTKVEIVYLLAMRYLLFLTVRSFGFA